MIPEAPQVTIESSLWIYGPLGILAIVLLIGINYLWRALTRAQDRLETERKEHTKLLDDTRKDFLAHMDTSRREFLAQMEVLIERERQSNATMMGKYHTLAEGLHLVLEKFVDRQRGKGE